MIDSLLPTLRANADAPDREARFPAESWRALYEAGLLAAAVPAEHGGMGLGPQRGRAGELWALTRRVAWADLSLARCWEGHHNAVVLIDGMGTAAQQQRWFAGVVRGEGWAAWSGEPRVPKPGDNAVGTELERVDGGWRLTGCKVFATSATDVRWALLLVNPAGPGGARHAASPDTVLTVACDMQDPTVTVDGSWWDPMGMRSTVSHRVVFDGTFIPDDNVLGGPGDYLRQQWQTRFVPHYAASFLGAAEGVRDYALDYLRHPKRSADPYVQQRMGRIDVDVETCALWLEHVARLWDGRDRAAAELAGSKARYMVEVLAAEVLQDCAHACGARAFVRPSPFERAFRDLTVYLRHDSLDHVLATVGRAVLGGDFDPSFHAP